MAAFSLEPLGAEPMSLGSPTSPKPGASAQFLPGFLMGDFPTPGTPQPRPSGFMDIRTPLMGGSSPPQNVVPTPKDKSGAPPVRSIYDDIISPGYTPKKPSRFSTAQTSVTGVLLSTPCDSASDFSPATLGQGRKRHVSPNQLDGVTSDDQLDDTWVTVFGYPQASASYILLQFAQFGNIVKRVMSNTGNWMHIQYQSKLQARKALSKDGKIFGDCIMIGVKPCIDKSALENAEKTASISSFSADYTPPTKKSIGTPTQQIGTPRSAMRPLSAAYKTSSSDYQVFSDKQTPKKDESLVTKAMEYLLGW